MKKLALISVICFLALICPAHSTGTEITWDGEVMLYCQEACVEGLKCNWVAIVQNTDTSSFTFKEMKIVNENNQTVSFARLNFTLKPRWTGRIGVEGLIPKPTDGLVYYKLCLKLEQKGITEYACQDAFIATPATAAEETQCLSDSDCSEQERCVNHKCKFITCENCSYVSNHTCVPFECCFKADCGVNQTCADHMCVNITEKLNVPENYTHEKIRERAIGPYLNYVVLILILVVMTSLLWGILKQHRKRC